MYSMESELLYQGECVPGMEFTPEALPIFAASAFTWGNVSEARKGYAEMRDDKNYGYNRSANPNRQALGEAISYLEGGEYTEICSSGMGAISATLFSCLKAGDHAVYGACCYGETLEIFSDVLANCGVESTPVNFSDMEAVKAAIRPNTKVLYCEICSNPNMDMADIDAAAKLAHENGALLIVDNTFTTPVALRPIEHGADLVINSLTKFLNGHSDCVQGSVTGKYEMVRRKIHNMASNFGTTGDAFSSWLVLRSMKTAEMRIKKQLKNAALLAAALEKDPHVKGVNHPSLKSFPQHETAVRMFGSEDMMTPMISIYVEEDLEKMDEFFNRLHFGHYVPSLGGVRTSLQHPVTSSHSHMPDEERRKVGVTPGMLRISVGCEEAEDLIADFTQALKAFD